MTRRSYWSNSKFANSIRGVKKPTALSSCDWAAWEETVQNQHPFRYWAAETALSWLQNVVFYIPDVITNIRQYITNRFITQTHALIGSVKDCPRGQWQDVGSRFLPCLFNELVDFVEIEKAHCMVSWNDADVRAKYNYPKFKSPFNQYRNAQAGLDYLDWEISLVKDQSFGIDATDPEYLKPTNQAIVAKKIKQLYTWFTVIRPNRPNADDVSGWTEICNEKIKNGKLFNRDKTAEQQQRTRQALKSMEIIEQQYEAEDTEKLIELIMIRNSLWT